MSKKILIVLVSSDWVGVARLPRSLSKAGFEVAAICSKKSYLSKTKYLSKLYPFNVFGSSVKHLVKTIIDFRPDLIIPGCELSVEWLHSVVARMEGSPSPATSYAFDTIKSSLGNPKFYEVIQSKKRIHAVAQKLNLRVPMQLSTDNYMEAVSVAARIGYPVVLKKEYGFGGNGVVICKSEKELNDAYHHISSNKNEAVDIQEYIYGDLAICACVAEKGKVLDSVAAFKEQAYPTAVSPSSVVRFFDNPAVNSIVAKLVMHLEFNGFCSCDLIIQKNTGLPYLLEFNPRPVPLTHLGHLYGHDLSEALAKKIGEGSAPVQSVGKCYELVSLFPNEWLRDPNSQYINSGYYDVPWDCSLPCQ